MELTPIFLELRFSLIELSYHVSYIYGSLVDVRAVVQIGTTWLICHLM